MTVHSQPPAALNVAENTGSASDGIVFLHLRLGADGTLTLLDTQTRSGILKAGDADTHGGTVRCQVVSTAGQVLWTASLDDPASKRVEWEDPARPGHILSKLVETPGTEFTVRVPRYAAKQRVEFRRPAAGKTSAGTNAAADTKADREIGAFDLTLP